MAKKMKFKCPLCGYEMTIQKSRLRICNKHRKDAALAEHVLTVHKWIV